jgi:hypothetical protein
VKTNGNRREQIAYLHGRADQWIEFWAERFGWNPVELATNLGAILIGAPLDRVPGAELPSSPAWQEGKAVAEMEVAERAHGGRASGTAGKRVGPAKAAKNQVKRKWVFTAARKAALARTNKKRFGGKKRSGALGRTNKKSGQKLYAQRYEAKRKGLPMPPLPSEKKQAA